MNVVLRGNQCLTENQGTKEAVSFPLTQHDRSEYRIIVYVGVRSWSDSGKSFSPAPSVLVLPWGSTQP